MSKKYLDTKKGSLEQSVLGVWQAAVEEQAIRETNKNDKSDDGEGLDAVQPKAVKKKFKDRKDKDIDNDGDVDDSDKFLHKRRKAVSTAMKNEEVEESLFSLTDEEFDFILEDADEETLDAFDVFLSDETIDEGILGKIAKKVGGAIASRIPGTSARRKRVIAKAASREKQRGAKAVKVAAKRKEKQDYAKAKTYLKTKKKASVFGDENDPSVKESYEMGTDEYREHTQSITPGQDITDFQRFKVESMKEALAKVWGFKEDDKKKRQEGKTATGEKSDEIDLNPKLVEKKA